MFEINLCCPECGGLEWSSTEDESVFECVCCGCNCKPEEMTPEAFKI